MNDPLRDRRNLADLASNGQVIEIAGVVGDFGRLVGVVSSDLDALDAEETPADWRKLPVTGKLQFDAVQGDGRAARLSGELEATLVSVCQRCLKPFEWTLATTISLVLVEAGGTGGSHDGFEVWELDGSDARPAEIVDEALVMAMPLSVRHDELDDCVDLRSGDAPVLASAATGERMTTPFAGLAGQMGKGTKD
ncbi:MAG: DUF177 domain-containing protein [Woeseiaceae bacterium]|nr:DUF177 domain-containing protein [Woeseiaceae bacterium]